MLPPAPGLFSMMNCWPNRSDNHWPTRRAVMSVAPAEPKGTTSRTGRDGYACAHAKPQTHGSGAAPAARCRNWLGGGSFFGGLLPDRLCCTRVNGRGRAMGAWIDRTNDGLSGMPADGITLPLEGGLRHVPLGRLEG